MIIICNCGDIMFEGDMYEEEERIVKYKTEAPLSVSCSKCNKKINTPHFKCTKCKINVTFYVKTQNKNTEKSRKVYCRSK